MLQPFREQFNAHQFTPERHAALIARLNARTQTEVEFCVSETPCFFPLELMEEMAETGRVLTHMLIDDPEYMRRTDAIIPERFRVPNDNPVPNFMTVDFGLVRGASGRLEPRLVEMQAFPSILGYQELLNQEYAHTYGLDEGLSWRLSGLTEEAYWELLRRTIVGDHESENVILLEVEPELQKTKVDFRVYADHLGVATVDITQLTKSGRKLFYQRDGRSVPVERIFNRAIVDELERKGITPSFDHRDDLEVTWAGQPNWYYRISKFSLPFLNHPAVPPAVFLNDWFAGRRGALPDDREQLLLKPLYSFAGKGIQFAPTDAELQAIVEQERGNYLLQQRVSFEPVIDTPYGMTQAEIRFMYLWPDGDREMTPVTTLVRMGRGRMMGVDHNRDQAWVGGSGAFFPRGI